MKKRNNRVCVYMLAVADDRHSSSHEIIKAILRELEQSELTFFS